MNHKKILATYPLGVLLFLLAVTLGGTRQVFAGDGSLLRTSVSWHPQSGAGLVDGAYATLRAGESGVSFTLHTNQLKAGNIYTLWFVAINAPENCATSPCTASDILGNTELVRANVTYGAGHIAGGSGQAAFAGQISAGAMPEGWYDIDFSNPLGAEIHLVLNDHGPMIPDLVSNMLHTYRGGCTDASLPPPFPATAKADGTPGPNTCRLYQSAIFQQ